VEPLLRRDQVVQVLGGVAEVDLDPADPALADSAAELPRPSVTRHHPKWMIGLPSGQAELGRIRCCERESPSVGDDVRRRTGSMNKREIAIEASGAA
jgi:hypothetical protein